MNETEYWLNLEQKHNELIDYTRELEDKLEKIKEYVKYFPLICKEKGVCIDDRLCCTCFYGSGLEVCDDILDIIEGAEDEQ